MMFVGGEFFYDNSWLLVRPVLDTRGAIFLNGGTACLSLIGEVLRRRGVQRVLLPSYLCPVILTTLERVGLDCDFYQVNEDLSIDLEDAARGAEGTGAFLFINYFGFAPGPAEQRFIQQLREGGVAVIEDNAQAGCFQSGFTQQPHGDFAFNSLRKFVPYDGGYLLSAAAGTEELEAAVTSYHARFPEARGQRLPLARAYRSGLADYLLRSLGSHQALAALHKQAERAYEGDFSLAGDKQEQEAIERLDWDRINRTRRENSTYLLGLLRSVPGVQPVFHDRQMMMPLGLPVYLDGGIQRGQVLSELAKAQIGAVAHWDAIRSHPRLRKNRLAAAMARRMLTLPVDQRAGPREMEYLALQLVRAVEAARR